MTGGYFVRAYEVWRSTSTTNAYGEVIKSWGKHADVPGRAYVARMTDAFAAARQQGIVTWTFATPATTDIVEQDQVRFDGRTLTVNAVSVTSRGDRIEATCEERRP